MSIVRPGLFVQVSHKHQCMLDVWGGYDVWSRGFVFFKSISASGWNVKAYWEWFVKLFISIKNSFGATGARSWGGKNWLFSDRAEMGEKNLQHPESYSDHGQQKQWNNTVLVLVLDQLLISTVNHFFVLHMWHKKTKDVHSSSIISTDWQSLSLRLIKHNQTSSGSFNSRVVRASPDWTGHSSDLKSVFIATKSFEEHCLKFDVGTSGQVILYVAVQEEALEFCLVNMKLHRGD